MGLNDVRSAGDRLRLAAVDFNNWQEAARIVLKGSNVAPESIFEQYPLTIARVRNDGEDDLQRFDVIGLNDPIILAKDNLNEFLLRPSFGCEIPVSGEHEDKWGVLLEPVAAGSIGFAAVAGVVPVGLAVSGSDSVLGFGEIVGGKTTLGNVASGSARILWAADANESGKPWRWALARIGAGGGGDTCPFLLPYASLAADTILDLSSINCATVILLTATGTTNVYLMQPHDPFPGTGDAQPGVILVNTGTQKITLKNATGQGADSATVASGGTLYAVGDVLTVSGGTLLGTAAAKFTVSTVDMSGAVTGVTLKAAGGYSATPTNPASTTGGSGTGCTLTVAWSAKYQFFNPGNFDITLVGSVLVIYDRVSQCWRPVIDAGGITATESIITGVTFDSDLCALSCVTSNRDVINGRLQEVVAAGCS